jgi:hypothetical protein
MIRSLVRAWREILLIRFFRCLFVIHDFIAILISCHDSVTRTKLGILQREHELIVRRSCTPGSSLIIGIQSQRMSYYICVPA